MNLFDQLSQGVSNFASTGASQMGGAGMGLVPQTGNPIFTSQIDLSVETVVTEITSLAKRMVSGDEPAQAFFNEQIEQISLPSVAADKFGSSIPVPIFGNSDFAAGFVKSMALNAPNVGKLIGGFIVTQDGFAYSVSNDLINATGIVSPTIEFYSEAVKQGIAKKGDLIVAYVSPVSNIELPDESLQSKFQILEVVVSCPQVAYGTLLDAISSDTFVIDGIRYTVPDVTKIDQFTNAIQTVRQSLFGKLQSDSMNPNSMNMPFNNQTNIIDVPLQLGVDKNLIVNTRINASCRKFIWSLFIKTTQKIKA